MSDTETYVTMSFVELDELRVELNTLPILVPRAQFSLSFNMSMHRHETNVYHFVYEISNEDNSLPVKPCRNALFQHCQLLKRLWGAPLSVRGWYKSEINKRKYYQLESQKNYCSVDL